MQPNYKFCAALSAGRDELLACNKFELSHRRCYTVNVVLFGDDFVCESCLVWFWMNGYKGCLCLHCRLQKGIWITMVLGVTVSVSIIRNVMEIIQCCVLFLIMDKPRYAWKKTIGIYAVFITLCTAVSTIWVLVYPQSYGKLITVSFFIVSVIFFRCMSSCSISQVLYTVSLLAFVQLWGIGMGVRGAMIFFDGNVWADIFFRFLYFWVVVWLYYRYFRRIYIEIKEYMGPRWKWMAAVALAGDFLFIYCSIYPQHVMISDVRDRIISCGVGIILFATHVIMLRAIYATYSELKAREEMEYSLLNNAYLEHSLAMIKEKVEQAARARHDARHHDLVIMEYARRGAMEELLRYMEEKAESEEMETSVCFCGNKTVNSILSAYAQKAKQAGIRMTVEATVKQDIGIKDIDFTAILGNVLENAVHGCMKAEVAEPFIDVKIQEKSNKLAILASNSCHGKVVFENGIPQSEKSGIGVKSMMRSAAEYNGQWDFQCADNIFKVRIVLNTL